MWDRRCCLWHSFTAVTATLIILYLCASAELETCAHIVIGPVPTTCQFSGLTPGMKGDGHDERAIFYPYFMDIFRHYAGERRSKARG